MGSLGLMLVIEQGDQPWAVFLRSGALYIDLGN